MKKGVRSRGDGVSIDYQVAGSTCAEFHGAVGFVKGLLGPVGSGKSSACVMEIILHTMKQVVHNGFRRARWAVVRNTFPELKNTTIKTWTAWIPEHVAPIKWDAPYVCNFKVKDIGDGTGLDLEVIFLAIDKPQDTGKLRSLELTGVWINEASELPLEVFEMCTQRVGRFPPKRDGGVVEPCVIMDTNPPDDDHWWYKFAEIDRPTNWHFFRQAGGLRWSGESWEPNPDAENVFNLPQGYDYYLQMIGGKSHEWVRIFVGAEYGTTSAGKPVYPEFNDRIHVAPEPLRPIPSLPIYVGLDFGLTPACVIAQVNAKGQLCVLDELTSEDMGIRQFSTEIVKPLLINKYSGYKLIVRGDPSGINRSQTDEKTCYQELYECGIPAEPASTNDFLPRREAVAFFLTKMAGGEAGLILDPSIKDLRKGFNGGYHYERLKVSGEARYRDRPVKNHYSHCHDAFQYLCLGIRGVVRVVSAKQVVTKNIRAWA